MNVPNPRRVLAVALTESSDHLSRVVTDLTGTSPLSTTGVVDSSSLAGTTHVLPLKTAYYAAEVPLWLDLVGDPAEWADSFLSPEAREVLDVLGGVVVVFDMAAVGGDGEAESGSGEREAGGRRRGRELVKQVGRVVKEGLGGWEWDGVGVVVGVGGGGDGDGEETIGGRDAGEVMDEWEDECAAWGMEFVRVPARGSGEEQENGKRDVEGNGRNEFGEKMGISRLLEALEANDWAQAGGVLGDDDDDEGGAGDKAAEADDASLSLDPESLEFGFDREDFKGLKQAIWSAGRREEEDEEGETEDDVQKLEDMMKKLLAVREMSAGLPEDQRRRMAQRAVGEVMREL